MTGINAIESCLHTSGVATNDVMLAFRGVGRREEYLHMLSSDYAALQLLTIQQGANLRK